ncbi:hypothetical protein [Novosphingobium sp. ST904]|uniref:hypothetical protein n=1 Tax=Novosphingobium sp. ST904 TaxID=1684385 RepID=UPI0006C8DDA2|nr:hypothetical protein [Novosphingobium sp. ST904]KPH62308.1 hypothetical protein ADT71_15310 [Novosphingobium sp. ST904]
MSRRHRIAVQGWAWDQELDPAAPAENARLRRIVRPFATSVTRAYFAAIALLGLICACAQLAKWIGA